MSLTRTFAVRLPLAVGGAAAVSMLLGLGGVLMCSTYPTYKDLPTDCTAESPYVLSSPPLDDFSQSHWWTATDYTPGAGIDGGIADAAPNAADAKTFVASASFDYAVTIPEGPLCQKYQMAGVFRASHNDDWGSIFGMWSFGAGSDPQPLDASAWEGISFWARAPGNTTKGFTLLLDDDNTRSDSVTRQCTSYSTDGGAPTSTGSPVGLDPSTGTPLSGSGTARAPYVDECGNAYNFVMQVTSDWRFYTVSWSDFEQAGNPNRVPNSLFDGGPVPETGLQIARLRGLTIRVPKEAEFELWLADLTFYRRAQ